MNWNDLQNVLQRVTQPIKNKISLMVGRALITAITDTEGIQQCQVSVLAGESMDKIPHFQNFGFTSNPPKGSEGIVVALQGNRENLTIIALDHRDFRVKGLATGESAFYNQFGAKVVLKTNKDLEAVVNKFKISNSSHELIQVLVDLVQGIIDARTQTAIGPQPLINVEDDFGDIKTRLETFKS
jgi:phage baseplate assembly protein V